jgi:16S rRNA (guanine966-N2)-methyltransferase
MDDKHHRGSADQEGQPSRRPFERGPDRSSLTERPYNRGPRPPRQGGASRFSGRPVGSGPGNRLEDPSGRRRPPSRGQNQSGRFSPRPFDRNRPKTEEQIPKPKIVSDRQITEGKFIGKKIETVDLAKFKQTSRRLREVFFRILGKKIRGRRFLDVRCGVGTMGIEALSRGAGLATFVDRSARMIAMTKKNLDSFEIKQGHAELLEIEALPFLIRAEKAKRKWDVVFVGIPDSDDSEELFSYFKRGVSLTKGSALVLEHHSSLALPEKTGRLRRRKIVVQGDVTMTFYEFR